jgi:hypothetical protein
MEAILTDTKLEFIGLWILLTLLLMVPYLLE